MDKDKDKDKDREFIVIIGASGLLGSSLCKALSDKYSVVAVVRDQTKILSNHEVSHIIEVPDFSINSVHHIINCLIEKSLDIYAIINCARSLKNLSVSDDYLENSEKFLAYLNEELLFNKAIIDMSTNKFSSLKSIVLTSSIYGNVVPKPVLSGGNINGYPQQYGVAKSALQYLVKDFAIRLRPLNINVNAVALGGIKGRSTTDFEKKYLNLNAASEMLDVHECVGVYRFLISDASGPITGQSINVDKGFTLC